MLEDKWVQAEHGLGVSESDEKILMDLPGEYSLATKGTDLKNVCGPGRKAQSQFSAHLVYVELAHKFPQHVYISRGTLRR